MKTPSISPLEDTKQDILRKALSMAGLTPDDLPSGLDALPGFLEKKLQLDPEAWLNLPDAIPEIPLPSGLKRHIFPFGEWTVNIWTLEAPEGLIAIDTGLSPDQLKQAIPETRPAAILITHLHRDHTGGLSAFPGIPVYGPGPGPGQTKPGRHALPIAGLKWDTFDLTGHTPDGIGWYIDYRGIPLFFPGDSIFAGSIGKCAGSEATAMKNILHAMRTLPTSTLVCPGHGPATTVSQEWKINPFLVLHNTSPSSHTDS